LPALCWDACADFGFLTMLAMLSLQT